MPQINPTDLTADPADYEQDAETFFAGDIEDLVDTVLILGQLDPTEIDLRTGQPRWTENQRKVIVKAVTKLPEWQD
jgi:hypothetical protein